MEWESDWQICSERKYDKKLLYVTRYPKSLRNIPNYVSRTLLGHKKMKIKSKSQITNKFHRLYHSCAITNWNRRFCENIYLILTSTPSGDFFASMIDCYDSLLVIRPTDTAAFVSHSNWNCYTFGMSWCRTDSSNWFDYCWLNCCHFCLCSTSSRTDTNRCRAPACRCRAPKCPIPRCSAIQSTTADAERAGKVSLTTRVSRLKSLKSEIAEITNQNGK